MTHTEITAHERRSAILTLLARRRNDPSIQVTVTAILHTLELEYPGIPLPSAKTLRRDLQKMAQDLEEEMGETVLFWDASSQSWDSHQAILDIDFILPETSRIVMGELGHIHLFLAQQALVQFEHTPLYRPLRSVFDQIMRTDIPRAQQRRIQRLSERIFVTGSLTPPLDDKIFDLLLGALDRNHCVEIDYRNAQGKSSTRIIHPLALVMIDRRWHVLAHDNQNDALRTFLISRIHCATLTGEQFDLPKNFDLKRIYDDAVDGYTAGGSTYNVQLRYPAEHAKGMSDHLWHQHQTQTTLEDGSIDVHFKTSALFRVEQDVLSFAGRVQVISPASLQKKIAKAARTLLDSHG